MIELIDKQTDVAVAEAEYKRLLGFPADYSFDGRVRELAHWAQTWYQEKGKPWVYAQEISLEVESHLLRLGGSEFSSKRLHEQLIDAGANRALLVVVSAGKECEEKAQELWLESKPDEYFFMEVYGS